MIDRSQSGIVLKLQSAALPSQVSEVKSCQQRNTSTVSNGAQKEIKVEGFFTLNDVNYQYSAEVREERLRVWLKSLGSGKQWYRRGMEKAEYVTPANAIAVLATLSPTDYIEFFREALECQSANVHRKVTSLEDGQISLEVSMTLRFLSKSWGIKYWFNLDPITQERIDELEFTVRNQQSELRRMKEREDELQRELVELRKGTAASRVLLEASKRDGRQRLQWEKVESVNFMVVGQDGVVKIRESGVYTIGICMTGISKSSRGTISLTKNSHCIHQVKVLLISLGAIMTTGLALTTQFDKGDDLSITCNYPPSGTSYLSIARLSSELTHLCYTNFAR